MIHFMEVYGVVVFRKQKSIVSFSGYVAVCEPGTCECPLFLGFNPPKDGPLQSKQGSFGFQVYSIFSAC